jgi:hypothetical protein
MELLGSRACFETTQTWSPGETAQLATARQPVIVDNRLAGGTIDTGQPST